MADPASIDERLVILNQRLKAAQLGVSIEQRGHKLSLRGTLPPRPGSDRLRPYQQRLSLNLPATPGGLKQAEQQAKIIAGQLLQQTFSWQAYLPMGGGKRLSQMDLAEKIDAFQQAFFDQQRSRPASARTTWQTAYAPYLRKLEAIARTTPSLNLAEAIQATIKAIPEDSRGRQVCCTALQSFVTFLDLDLPFDLKQWWGTYNAATLQPRRLPSDTDILNAYAMIPNPAWRFVFGVMATYGLRNHEVFYCDYSALQQTHGDAIVEVLEPTKTGHHEVWPFYPEWVDHFSLRHIQLPKLQTDLDKTTLQRVGQRVSAQFRRYGLPFSPYDLRHAWAVRTIHFGLPDTVAARMMGHSVAIHTRTYHRWISRRDQQQAVDAARQRQRSPVLQPLNDG
ncbi:site-specific integrase [Leptolyngbya sp. CCY15150]|uniref:site-specific integrase n=1 Tax=Leptolyngbya sp. CCY15150 TaxID=2767772 RepID=UPI00194EF9D5|nr:site-specific integrase [Leptolyngbya sp. CCY15150]